MSRTDVTDKGGGVRDIRSLKAGEQVVCTSNKPVRGSRMTSDLSKRITVGNTYTLLKDAASTVGRLIILCDNDERIAVFWERFGVLEAKPDKSQWFGYKYRVTPETSKLLQEAVFKDGGGWWDHSKDIMNLRYDNLWLFVTVSGGLSWSTVDAGDLPEKQPPQTMQPPKKDFVVGKWYKFNDMCVAYMIKGNYYLLEKFSSEDGKFLFGCKDDAGNFNYYLKGRFDINSESDFDPLAVYTDLHKHTAYVKFKGYSGNYDSKEYCYKCDDSVYGSQKFGQFIYASVNVSGEIKTVQVQRIMKDYLDPKATKCIIGIVDENGLSGTDQLGEETYQQGNTTVKVKGDDVKVFVGGEPLSMSNFFNQDRFSQEMEVNLTLDKTGNSATTNVGDVNNMSTQNRVVSVKFFDDDAGLKAENSLVASYEITTRANDAMTVNKLLMREDIAGDIDLHNAVRASTVDATILKSTGNKVFLQPIDFEDLRVVVSNV